MGITWCFYYQKLKNSQGLSTCSIRIVQWRLKLLHCVYRQCINQNFFSGLLKLIFAAPTTLGLACSDYKSKVYGISLEESQ